MPSEGSPSGWASAPTNLCPGCHSCLSPLQRRHDPTQSGLLLTPALKAGVTSKSQVLFFHCLLTSNLLSVGHRDTKTHYIKQGAKVSFQVEMREELVTGDKLAQPLGMPGMHTVFHEIWGCSGWRGGLLGHTQLLCRETCVTWAATIPRGGTQDRVSIHNPTQACTTTAGLAQSHKCAQACARLLSSTQVCTAPHGHCTDPHKHRHNPVEGHGLPH